MNKAQVITRLCMLSSEVGKVVFRNDLASDCFCGINPIAGDSPTMDEQVIEYIEKAVLEKMRRNAKRKNRTAT